MLRGMRTKEEKNLRLSRRPCVRMVAASAVVTSLCLVGLAQLVGAQTEITWWMGSWWKDAGAPVIEKFEKLHPEIKVDLELIPWPGYFDKSAMACMGADAPDVLALNTVFASALASRGLMTSMDQYVGKTVNSGDYFDGIWKGGQSGGKQIGIPYRVSARGLYYNPAHYTEAGLDPDKPPKNLDEFLDYAKKLTTEDHYATGDALSLSSPSEAMRTVYEHICSFGGRVLDEDFQRSVINQEPAVNGVKWLAELITKHKVASRDSIGLIEDELAYRFGAGKLSMMIGGYALRDYVTKTSGPDFEFKTAPAHRSVGIWGWYLTVPENAEHKEEAMTFISWFTNPDILLENAIRVPTVKKAPSDPVWGYGGEKESGPFLESLEKGVSIPPIEEWNDISRIVVEKVHEIIIAQRDAQLVMDNLKEEIDNLLAY